MAQYAIEDTTMTALADAVRSRVGETRKEEVGSIYLGNYKVSKTSNALSFTERDGDYGTNLSVYDTITIPGAIKIIVDVAYQNEGGTYDYLQIASGALTSMPSSATKYANKTLTRKELTFENTNTITFYFKSDSSNGSYLGYYAECRGYDAEDNLIEMYEIEYEEVLNTMTIEDMINVIPTIQTYPELYYSYSTSDTKDTTAYSYTFDVSNASKLQFDYELKVPTSNTSYYTKWTLIAHQGYKRIPGANNIIPTAPLTKIDTDGIANTIFSGVYNPKSETITLDVSNYTCLTFEISSDKYTSGAYSWGGYLHLYNFRTEK